MEQENLNKGTPPPETEVIPEVNNEAKQKPPKPDKPKKELTPAELQKRKKMLIMPLFFLIFGASLWFIFAPSGKDKEKEAQQAGLNVELPMPKDGRLVSDKRAAYQQEAMQQKEKARMQSLQDFSAQLADVEEQVQNEDKRQSGISKPVEYYENPSRTTGGNKASQRHSSIQTSATAYQDINKQLGTWYEDESSGAKDQAQLAVEQRINELERKLEEAEATKATEKEQLAMMEKSYQMAAKYMPAQAGQPAESTNAAASETKDKVNIQPVKQVRHNVVSLLAAPMSDNEFIESFSKPRNMSFLTAAGNEGVQDKNSIRACIYQTVTLTNGKELQIRLLEPMRAGNILIPANTVVTGTCRIGGERMDVTINSIQYADNIIPVEILVYDTDGQKGISVPGSDEVKAAKEVASTLANSAGTSIMISDDAGSQLAADMGKGLIQGASQYLSKKMSVVKVTLKANYRILLLPKTQ